MSSFYKPGEYEKEVSKKINQLHEAIDVRNKIREYVEGELEEEQLRDDVIARTSKPVVNAIEKLGDKIDSQGVPKDFDPEITARSIDEALNSIVEELELAGEDPNYTINEALINQSLTLVGTQMKSLTLMMPKLNPYQLHKITILPANIADGLVQILELNYLTNIESIKKAVLSLKDENEILTNTLTRYSPVDSDKITNPDLMAQIDIQNYENTPNLKEDIKTLKSLGVKSITPGNIYKKASDELKKADKSYSDSADALEARKEYLESQGIEFGTDDVFNKLFTKTAGLRERVVKLENMVGNMESHQEALQKVGEQQKKENKRKQAEKRREARLARIDQQTTYAQSDNNTKDALSPDEAEKAILAGVRVVKPTKKSTPPPKTKIEKSPTESEPDNIEVVKAPRKTKTKSSLSDDLKKSIASKSDASDIEAKSDAIRKSERLALKADKEDKKKMIEDAKAFQNELNTLLAKDQTKLKKYEIQKIQSLKSKLADIAVVLEGQKGKGVKKPTKTTRLTKTPGAVSPKQFLELQKTGVDQSKLKLGKGSSTPPPRNNNTKRPYVITGEWFGNLKIDKTALNQNMRVIAHDGAKKVMDRAIDLSTFDLLTKNWNSKKEYSKGAWQTFTDLLALSDLSVAGKQGGAKVDKVREAVAKIREKKRTGNGIKGCGIKLYKSSAELENRKKLIDGVIRTGNNNPELVEEKSEIDEVLNKARAKK